MHSLPIASDLSYEVLERRRSFGQLATPPLDNANCRLYGLGVYRAFIADVDEDSVIGGDFRGDHAIPGAADSGLPVRAGK